MCSAVQWLSVSVSVSKRAQKGKRNRRGPDATRDRKRDTHERAPGGALGGHTEAREANRARARDWSRKTGTARGACEKYVGGLGLYEGRGACEGTSAQSRHGDMRTVRVPAESGHVCHAHGMDDLTAWYGMAGLKVNGAAGLRHAQTRV